MWIIAHESELNKLSDGGDQRIAGNDVRSRSLILNTPTTLGRSPISVRSPITKASKSVKRNLNISPSTPVGLPRKLLFRELNQEISQVSFGEDIEMLSVETDTSGENAKIEELDIVNTDGRSPRRILRANRREYTNDSIQLPARRDNRAGGHEKTAHSGT